MAFKLFRTSLTTAGTRFRPFTTAALGKSFFVRSTTVINGKALLPTSTATLMNPSRTFLTSPVRFSNGDVDPDLVHQLEEEIQFEQDDEKNEVPAFVQEFLDADLFEIDDKAGHDKVVLKRTFGNEKISVIFSISDINNTVEEFTEEVDGENNLEVEQAVEKEEGDKENETAIKEEIDNEDDKVSFPVRATIVVQKKDKGSLVLNTVAQDGYLHIDAVRYFKEGQIDHNEIHASEIGETRQDLYMGPAYEELDEELQLTFTRYLEERGIDTALATFLPDYVDYKEQKEYVGWLKDVNEFVSA